MILQILRNSLSIFYTLCALLLHIPVEYTESKFAGVFSVFRTCRELATVAHSSSRITAETPVQGGFKGDALMQMHLSDYFVIFIISLLFFAFFIIKL